MSAITFVALFRGRTPGDARIIATTTDSSTVDYVSRVLQQEADRRNADTDPAVNAVLDGRRRALRILNEEGATR